MWWFSRSPAQDKVILYVDDRPVRGENGKYNNVMSAKARPDGRVQIWFEDGSTRELLLADFSIDGVAPSGAEEFAKKVVQLFPTGHWMRHLAIGAICAPLAVAGVVVALPAIGFTAGGIAAGSYAANMMSAAAIANGGGVAAGSLVAGLQSAGAAGLGAGAMAAVGGAGAAAGAGTSYLVGKAEDHIKEKKDKTK